MITLQIAFLLMLIVLNGFFAMSELAIVSAKRAVLSQRAEAGSRGATVALRLAEDSTRFLATIQIGITLIGILAGALGGAALSEPLADWLARNTPLDATAEAVAFGAVVVAITYLSLTIGELAPKRIALSHAETIAARVAIPLRVVSKATAPLVVLLQVSTELLLRLLRVRPQPRSISDEEIAALLAEGAQQGVLEPAEHAMLREVLGFPDRPVRSVMTPRADVAWTDVNAQPGELRKRFAEEGYSRFLVCDGKLDEVVGYVRVREVLAGMFDAESFNLRTYVREPHVVPEFAKVLNVLTTFRRVQPHFAVVVDEYGSVEGIVTPTDILETLAGDVSSGQAEGPASARREGARREGDGSWIVDGKLDTARLERLAGAGGLTEPEKFVSLAELVLEHAGRIPEEGDVFVIRGWQFEILDMDGRRIDKLRVRPMLDQARRTEIW